MATAGASEYDADQKETAQAETAQGETIERKEKKPWYDSFWPLGDRVDVHKLEDEYIPFQTEWGAQAPGKKAKAATSENPEASEDLEGSEDLEDSEDPQGTETTRTIERAEKGWFTSLFGIGSQDGLKGDFSPGSSESATTTLPPRPDLFVEFGDPFLDTGQLDAGFHVPIIGAVWQPRLWSYFIYRTALQTFDAGGDGSVRETEWANRLDLFVNLQLTGTEKILLGLRPLDENRPSEFTRYTFNGRGKEGFNEEFNYVPETLFFEGDLGSLFPVLDQAGVIPIDFGFTVGRQPIVFQEGILINDTLDALGFVRNNIPFAGTSNLRVSGLWAWNRVDRNDLRNTANADLFGLFINADTHTSTFNLDTIFINDKSGPTDGLYFGFSAIQRMTLWGETVATAFRANASIALEEEVAGVPGNVIGDGVLLTAEFSKHPHGSDDIVYFNPFIAIGNYTQAGREAVVGGPLANTGILFASPGLGNYLAEINPFTDDVVGYALGYQAFWDNNRRNLILETAARYSYNGTGPDSVGFGAQLQQAVGRHVQLTFEAYYTINDGEKDGAGARAEVQVVY
ncbi:MAG: hypothetical protein ACR2PM_14240 [Hyphomicrobiales bacterium]